MFKRRILQFLIVTCILSVPIFAYADTKINSVSLKIDIEDGDGFSDFVELDITAKGTNYSVGGYEITVGLNGDIDMEDDGDDGGFAHDTDEEHGPGASFDSGKAAPAKKSKEPVTCEITLSAEDGYYFYTMSKKNIKVSGLEANCTKASRQDSGKTLTLTVQLPGIKTRVGMVDEAFWKDENTAEWSAAANANSYEVRLYRNGKSTGKTYETKGRTFNFAPIMLRGGEYSYTVKALDSLGNSSKKTDSNKTRIEDELALSLKEKYSVKYDFADDGTGPDSGRNMINGGWQNENGRYWYRMDDGMYPQSIWMSIGDEWYWFDSEGFMIEDSWVAWKGNEYYFGSDGTMLTNETTPDGYTVNTAGEKIN